MGKATAPVEPTETEQDTAPEPEVTTVHVPTYNHETGAFE